MSLHYIHLGPNSVLPDITNYNPFKAVLVLELEVEIEWQTKVSTWLVESGCYYMMAHGVRCSSWDDSVDLANLKKHEYNIPDEHRIMTTWHEDELLSDVFLFCEYGVRHPDEVQENTLIIHIASEPCELELLAQYEKSRNFDFDESDEEYSEDE